MSAADPQEPVDPLIPVPAAPDVTRYTPPSPNAIADQTRFTAEQADPEATVYTPAAAPGSRASRLPRPFGDYELLEELGRGGMGVVYKARHLKTGRLVALKMILSGALASPQAVERFRNEAKAAMALDHPGIVPIYEIGEVEGQHFFTLQWLAGGSLHQRLQQGPLVAAEAARVVRQLAEAVQHAHDRGVIHRDIKPANVLLSAEAGARQTEQVETPAPMTSSHRAPRSEFRVPKLTDFGLARLAEGSGLTATVEQLGTPSYMAPEQAAGRSRAVGPASDTYSLGALLYCLLTGRPPFLSATAVETMRLVQEQEPVPPRQLNPGVPRDLENVCLRCLEKQPRARYLSAAELADDLTRFLNGEPVKARPVNLLQRLTRSLSRNRMDDTFSPWAKAFFSMSVINVLYFLTLHFQRQAGHPHELILLTHFLGLASFFLAFAYGHARSRKSNPLEWQFLMVLYCGFASLIFIAVVQHLLEGSVPFEDVRLYPYLFVVNGLCFCILGSGHSGYFYIPGIVSWGLALIMPRFLDHVHWVNTAFWTVTMVLDSGEKRTPKQL